MSKTMLMHVSDKQNQLLTKFIQKELHQIICGFDSLWQLLLSKHFVNRIRTVPGKLPGLNAFG